MLLYGIAAAACLYLFGPKLLDWLVVVLEKAGNPKPRAIELSLVILVLLLLWSQARGRWLGFLGIKHWHTYPPLWFAVPFGFAAWAMIRFWSDGIVELHRDAAEARSFLATFPTWIALPTVMFIAGALVIGPLLPKLARLRRPIGNADARALDTFDNILRWAADDEAVTSAGMDGFDHDRIATRIAQRLLATPRSTVALVGPLGSGKTTICNLVTRRLQSDPAVRVVRVSLWPFESADAAVRGILESLVAELGRHVNVLPLVGLAEGYLSLIEAAASPLKGLLPFLRGAVKPSDQLKGLDQIASAAGLRFVLWIEDLERFSGGDLVSDEKARSAREAELLSPVMALLFLLNECEQVAVVVSDVSLRSRFDLGKVARFVERVPRLTPEGVWRIVSLARDGCLGGWPAPVIDPQSPASREITLSATDAAGIGAWLSKFSRSSPALPVAITDAVQTPRSLKLALRRTIEVWMVLAGEIDFDSVLAASVLRAVDPELISFVDDNIELFRIGFRNPMAASEKKNEPHAALDRAEKILARPRDGLEPEEAYTRATRALLRFLFPMYSATADDSERINVERPQALCVDQHADNWRRFLDQTPVPDDERDQLALEDILAWREGRPSGLVDRFLDARKAWQVATFVGQFKASEFCRLLIELSERLSTQTAEHWADGRERPPGLTVLWNMTRTRRPRPEQIAEAVGLVVERYAGTSIPLAAEVMTLYGEQNSVHLMSAEHANAIGAKFRQMLIAGFSRQGAETWFLEACRSGSPWRIARVLWMVHGPGDGDETWKVVASVLLGVAESRPAVGVPLVALMVSGVQTIPELEHQEDGSYRPASRPRGTFNENAARALFDFPRFLRAVANFTPSAELAPQLREQCIAVVEAARGILGGSAARPSGSGA
jgi:KAP family P-loop domain